jgi:hypothetical protein
MSKKKARQQKRADADAASRRKRIGVALIALLLSLGLAAGTFAQWRAARVPPGTNALLLVPPAPSPAANSPSKEYIYAGGRLLATEEPSGGTTVTPGTDTVWVEDQVPAGATLYGSGEGWTWTTSNPSPFSGATAHQSNNVAGFHNHYFMSAANGLEINYGDTLFTYVYIDAANPPSEIMVQWHDGTSWYSVYWGADYLNWVGTRHRIGNVPAGGQWVRLEVAASLLGLEGKTVTGMAFDLWDGRATWDKAGKSSTRTDEIYVEDSLPTGAVPNGTSEGWNWVSANPAPRSGTLSSQSNIVAGFHNHYFMSATQRMSVSTGDRLFAYVFIDPANIPSEIMVQWHDGTSWYNVYWGADYLNWVGTRHYQGAIPVAGKWVRLEVAASLLGLEGKNVSGMAFDMWDGRATWDRAGRSTQQVTPAGPENVVWNPSSMVGVSASGNNLTMTAAGGWGNAGASSTQTINSGDGYVEFTANNLGETRIVGLSNGDTNQSWQEIDFGIDVTGAGEVYLVESGTVLGPYGTYSAGNKFRISVASGQVKYYKEGVLFHTTSVTPNYPLLVDTALLNTGASINNAVIKR